jgi:hypothetical protein
MKKLFSKILDLNREVWTIILAFIAIFALTTLLILLTRNRNNNNKETADLIDYSSEQFIQATTVKKENVGVHSSLKDCWIIYKTGVYDISDIITKQKTIAKSQCGTEIESDLDAKTIDLISPYLVSYTYDSQTTQK